MHNSIINNIGIKIRYLIPNPTAGPVELERANIVVLTVVGPTGATVGQLDVNRKNLNNVRAESTVCPPQLFISQWNKSV